MVSGRPDAPPRLQILGPLRVWCDDVELNTGPRQQAGLLALLLARAGEPVGTDELIDFLWGERAPASALNVIQKYVGALRRLFEPGLAAREPGSYLQRRGESYVFVPAPGMLDLTSFRELAREARALLAEGRAEPSLDRYTAALALWRGPAGGGRGYGPGAMPVFAGLDGEFFDACLAATGVALPLGRAADVLGPLRLAAAMAPLHEPVHAGLITALSAAGRQAEALVAHRTVRDRLVEDLGIEPGPALTTAHRRVLNGDGLPHDDEAVDDDRLVGRVRELAVLRSAVTASGSVVLIEGEPGIGKTRLLTEAAAEAVRHGAAVVWGRCLDGDGTPSMWPWVQVVRAVLNSVPGTDRAARLDGELGRLVTSREPALPVVVDGGARFRLFEEVADLLNDAAAERPLVVVIDDLHWADLPSLRLFTHLGGRLAAGTVLLGALRDRAPAPESELRRTLATVSRLPGHRRLRLGPLVPGEVAELVRAETGREPAQGAVARIHERTAGNPFFVRELSRLLDGRGPITDDAVARAGVPAGVRDVVRDRLASLDDDLLELVRIAALAGRDVDLGLLARAAGIDAATCLARLEPLRTLGLLDPVDAHTGRFAHDLVREAVVGDAPDLWAPPLHLRIADALTAADHDSVVERVASHLAAAGPLADAARTAGALERAGRRAAEKSAFEAAEQRFRLAVRVARSGGLPDVELFVLTQLSSVVGMRHGYGEQLVRLLERAEHLAWSLGREREATDLSYSLFLGHFHHVETTRCRDVARRLLRHGEASADPLVRRYGLEAWGRYQWSVGNIGEARELFLRCEQVPLVADSTNLRRQALEVEQPLMHALAIAMAGDLDGARARFDEAALTGGDDEFAVTLRGHLSATVATMAGDPVEAARAVQRVDDDAAGRRFVQVDDDLRFHGCWARALAGLDPDGAAREAEKVLNSAFVDPVRSGVAYYHAVLAEMLLAAGRLDRAATALDSADRLMDEHGQRYPEGLVLLLRARLLLARGEPAQAVRAAAERAVALSRNRGSLLFAHRAETFLSSFPE